MATLASLPVTTPEPVRDLVAEGVARGFQPGDIDWIPSLSVVTDESVRLILGTPPCATSPS